MGYLERLLHKLTQARDLRALFLKVQGKIVAVTEDQVTASDTDTEELPGCASGDNNFVQAIDVITNEDAKLLFTADIFTFIYYKRIRGPSQVGEKLILHRWSSNRLI